MKAAAFNLTILSQLLGTALQPDLDGHVLMLEEVSEHMYRIDRALCHVTGNPGIRRVAGLRLGRCSAIPPNDPDFGLDEEAVARFWCGRSGIPWLGRADIGHDVDNRVVPFGRYECAASLIRPARPADAPALWAILEPVIRAGDTYALDPDMGEAEALAYWLGPDKETFVAEVDEPHRSAPRISAPTRPAAGGTSATSAYMTADGRRRGRGVARGLCGHALERARARGFRAMQFNSRGLDQHPRGGAVAVDGLRHRSAGCRGRFGIPVHGDVDALVMFRAL